MVTRGYLVLYYISPDPSKFMIIIMLYLQFATFNHVNNPPDETIMTSRKKYAYFSINGPYLLQIITLYYLLAFYTGSIGVTISRCCFLSISRPRRHFWVSVLMLATIICLHCMIGYQWGGKCCYYKYLFSLFWPWFDIILELIHCVFGNVIIINKSSWTSVEAFTKLCML